MQLTTIEEKLHRLQHLSVDHVVVAPFDAECSTREGSSFLRELRDLHPLEILVRTRSRIRALLLQDRHLHAEQLLGWQTVHAKG